MYKLLSSALLRTHPPYLNYWRVKCHLVTQIDIPHSFTLIHCYTLLAYPDRTHSLLVLHQSIHSVMCYLLNRVSSPPYRSTVSYKHIPHSFTFNTTIAHIYLLFNGCSILWMHTISTYIWIHTFKAHSKTVQINCKSTLLLTKEHALP